MTPLIITVDSELESAETLGFPTMSWEFREKCLSEYKNNFVIRWGNSFYTRNFKTGLEGEFPHVANKASAVRANCRHKQRASEKLSTVVNTPRHFHGVVPKGVKAVYRPIRHSGGSDFQVVTGPFDVASGHYAAELIETDTEIRCWFADGGVFSGLRVALSRLNQTSDEVCRSKWGYKYTNTPVELKKQVLAAAGAMGLVFGAADILQKGDKYYFLELNTAPTIDAPTVRRFFQNGINNHIAKYVQKIRS